MTEHTALSRQFRRFVMHPLEAAAAVTVYGVFAVLGVDAASNIGGLLGRAIGPLLPVNRRAVTNLRRAMPELTPAEITDIMRAMWDNLGRVMAEYPHLERIARDAGNGGRVAITGAEHIAAIRDDDAACILVSGHFSNFELFGLTAREYGILSPIFTAPPTTPSSTAWCGVSGGCRTTTSCPRAQKARARQSRCCAAAGGSPLALV